MPKYEDSSNPNSPEQKAVEPLELDERSMQRVKEMRREMADARDARNTNHEEFDGMTYLEWYNSNARAANSYVPPKKNKQDTRLVTGTTHEKDITMLSALLNYNFLPNVVAYEENDEEIYEAGETFEALLRKSNDIENPTYEEKRVLIYKEGLDQGDAFVEDICETYSVPDKYMAQMDMKKAGIDLSQNFDTKARKVWKQLSTNLIAGTNFYPGNIRTFWMQEQPFIFVRKIITRAQAQSMFGEWARWKHVPKTLTVWNGEDGGISLEYRNWTLEPIKSGQCEILQYQNKWTNEYQIFINGIPMLQTGFPLSALNGQCEYTIVKFAIEPMSGFFFYSKSIPAKTKVDQAIYDEVYRLLLLKFRQEVMPPMSNMTGRQISESIFYPAKITDNVSPDQLRPIMENRGITQSELAFVQFLKTAIDSKSVSPTFEGQAPQGNPTAREVMETQKHQMMKLGLTILGAMFYEMNRSYLRLYNILQYWTQEEDERANFAKDALVKIYKKVEIQDTFSDGSSGIKSIEFMNSDMKPIPDESQVYAEERLLSRPGRAVRKVYLDVKALRQVRLKWKINIEPVEKNSDALDRAQYEDSLFKALQIFGQRVNMDFQQKEFAKHAKWDADQAFVQPQPMDMTGTMRQMGGELPQGAMSAQMASMKQNPTPSVNTMMNA